MAARPITIAPVPIPISAYFWLWHTSAPERPTRPLAIMRAIIFVIFVFTPSARIISSLLPVARRAEPISVPKNQYKRKITAPAITRPISPDAKDVFMPVASTRPEKIVPVFNNGILLFPIIRRLIDQRDICVRIPAKIAGISNTVCRKPVTAPARTPAAVAIRRAMNGFTPWVTTSVAHTHPPSAKLPSTVRSAISRIL